MRYFTVGLLLLCFVVSIRCQESEDKPDKEKDKSWWSSFKEKVKDVLTKWRDDIKLLWDDVLAKADDVKEWTSEMFSSFKQKMKEWVDSRSEFPDDEKNEIESFISKLKIPTEKPTPDPNPKMIDP